VLRIQPPQPDADEVLIPFVDAYVDRVDREARMIHVDWDPSY
jgi:16S rRNA processing protein RimM